MFWSWIPTRGLSRWTGWAMRSSASRRLIPWYVRFYGIDLEPVQRPLADFENLLAFFTRRLKAEARPVAGGARMVVSPVDGTVSAIGSLQEQGAIVAKRGSYTVSELVGGREDIAQRFLGGSFAVFYLSPRDYHRVHVPLKGRLTELIHVPGPLHPVRLTHVQRFPRLFVTNERLAVLFETIVGPLLLVFIGATNVGSIRLAPFPHFSTNHYRPSGIHAQHCAVELDKGAELGFFELGSSVIVCLPPQAGSWKQSLTLGAPVVMGAPLLTEENFS